MSIKTHTLNKTQKNLILKWYYDKYFLESLDAHDKILIEILVMPGDNCKYYEYNRERLNIIRSMWIEYNKWKI